MLEHVRLLEQRAMSKQMVRERQRKMMREMIKGLNPDLRDSEIDTFVDQLAEIFEFPAKTPIARASSDDNRKSAKSIDQSPPPDDDVPPPSCF